MNLKKFAIRKKIDERLYSRSLYLFHIFIDLLQEFKSTRLSRVLFRQSDRFDKIKAVKIRNETKLTFIESLYGGQNNI